MKKIAIESKPSWDLVLLTIFIDAPKVPARRSREQYEKDIEQGIRKALKLNSRSRGFTPGDNHDFIVTKLKNAMMDIYDTGATLQRVQLISHA